MNIIEKDLTKFSTIRTKSYAKYFCVAESIDDIKEAIELANEANLDLVEISPNGKPPVCKILDFGKYKFDKEKKKKLNKKRR